jgi:hypothetical protein
MHRRELQFAVGDEVLLSTKDIKVKTAGTHKLLPKWIGPFKVLHCVNEVAYKLTLPSNLKIHPVFHVSLLKACEQGGRVQPPPVPELIVYIENELEYEVESVLAHRDVCVRSTRNRVRTLVLQRQYISSSGRVMMRVTTHGSLIAIVLIARTRLISTLLVFKQEPAQISINVLQMVVCRLIKACTFRGWCVILVYDLCARCPRGIIYTLQTHRV